MDSNNQADSTWLLSIQRKLYQWSSEHPDDQYRDLWNWMTDLRNLRCAWRTVSTNRGRRSAGVDGNTVAGIRRDIGEEHFLKALRHDLRQGRYYPQPCRRKWIPKPGKPGKFHPLGIPTVKDRVVQGAVKNILEPIFEASFWHVNYGFRPGRGCHGALEHIRMTIRPCAKAEDGRRHDPPYAWVIEGDIKGCFDHLSHHLLMQRLRPRIGDRKATQLICKFLKASFVSGANITASVPEPNSSFHTSTTMSVIESGAGSNKSIMVSGKHDQRFAVFQAKCDQSGGYGERTILNRSFSPPSKSSDTNEVGCANLLTP